MVINEILAHTDAPTLDFVELFNYGTGAVNLGKCVLTDDPTTNRFVIPAGTILPPGGFLVFDELQLEPAQHHTTGNDAIGGLHVEHLPRR